MIYINALFFLCSALIKLMHEHVASEMLGQKSMELVMKVKIILRAKKKTRENHVSKTIPHKTTYTSYGWLKQEFLLTLYHIHQFLSSSPFCQSINLIHMAETRQKHPNIVFCVYQIYLARQNVFRL